MKIKNFLEKTKDKNLAWFLGFSVGDGYTTYGRFGIDTTTPEIVNEKQIEMKECMKRLQVKWKMLKRCSNILESKNKINQIQLKKRVYFRIVN